LHFIWIVDCSESMLLDGKIAALNAAIRDSIPHLRDVAMQNPHAQVLARCLTFSSGHRWTIPSPTPVEQMTWTDLTASGYTDMGGALAEVAQQLKVPPLEPRALPPALVLVSDGQPTDDFDAGLATLMAEPWGTKAVRLAVAIGKDADLDVLSRFIGNPEVRPMQAGNAEQLTHFIRWASTVATRAASSPVAAATLQGDFAPPPIPMGAAPVDQVGATW
jgi:uncharacterized protein YegL